MAKIYVYSTLTNSQKYTQYKPLAKGAQFREVEHQVLIYGGSNLADKHLITPRGVATEITEEDYEMLKKNSVFLRHEKNGYVVVHAEKRDAEKVAAKELKAKDESAPLTMDDYKDKVGKEGMAVPQVKKVA